MPNQTPYDRTTPPSIPRTHDHSRRLRIESGFPRTRCSIDPLDVRPGIRPFSRPAPRGQRPHDGLYYRFTQSAREYSSTTNTAARQQMVLNSGFLGLQQPDISTEPKPKPSTIDFPDARPKLLNRTSETDTVRQFIPFIPMAQKSVATQMPLAAPPQPPKEPKPASKISAAAKATGWVANIRKKRRTSEIFNANFSFDVPSRRRPSDHTPQISPRTSFSITSEPRTPSIDESSKRQCIDSTRSEIDAEFPFGRPSPEASSRGRELGSSPTRIRPPAPSLSTPHHTPAAEDVHPGLLVDFASPRHDVHIPAPTPLSEYTRRMGTEAYSDFFATTWRRSSFPTGERGARRIRERLKMLARLKRAHAATKMFTADGTEREREIEKEKKSKGPLEWKEQTQRKIPNVESQYRSSSTAAFASASASSESTATLSTCTTAATTPTLPMTPSSSTSMQGSSSAVVGPDKAAPPVAVQRTISDPSTSAFLLHMRSSLEARKTAAKKWHDHEYPVFADEVEKGFLSDEPL